jgi:hydrogenase maturation protein HypF
MTPPPQLDCRSARTDKPGPTKRWRIAINGIVQGVGFRPFVYRLAHRYHLTGLVTNTTTGVVLEVEGGELFLALFLQDLKKQAPPLAVIDSIAAQSILPVADRTFAIESSEADGRMATQIAPDAAVCQDCLAELFDPADRRYLYPFINCTNCGPRYTIVENIPYDRPSTSMRHFTMCADCLIEYNDPLSRRFHAQPNCCPACGPQVSLHTPAQEIIAQAAEAVRQSRDLLQRGFILAIKGLGGFHLAVHAANDEAVQRLRRRKGREEKPLAIMVKDEGSAGRIGTLHDRDLYVLNSPQCPIVLVPKNDTRGISSHVAPDSDRFGIMLPYTPLHHLLLHNGLDILVMTSANVSEEPICTDNREAFLRLAGMADFFLLHDRPIYLRNDDSIVINLGGKTRQIRRSRGYAPRSLPVNSTGPAILGVGAELKNTICLLQDNQAVLSQHLGDLKNLEAYEAFQQAIGHLLLLFEARPELVVHDMHPQYLSSRWAIEQQRMPSLAVQHHHAHLAACLAENKETGPAIGLIMDGTGYGNDSTIWGGEVLIGDARNFSRYAHFEALPLPGGEVAVREPWRIAAAWLYLTFGRPMPDLPFLADCDTEPVIEITDKKIYSPLTSSCGRVFDAVAAMSGGRTHISYEAQAAIDFMQAAHGRLNRPYAYDILSSGGSIQISTRSLLKAIVGDLCIGESLTTVSQRFHATLVEMFTRLAVQAGKETGIRTVALGGGVFQNQLLFCSLLAALAKTGLRVISQALMPTNDGCISLGQAMIGRQHLQH